MKKILGDNAKNFFKDILIFIFFSPVIFMAFVLLVLYSSDISQYTTVRCFAVGVCRAHLGVETCEKNNRYF